MNKFTITNIYNAHGTLYVSFKIESTGLEYEFNVRKCDPNRLGSLKNLQTSLTSPIPQIDSDISDLCLIAGDRISILVTEIEDKIKEIENNPELRDYIPYLKEDRTKILATKKYQFDIIKSNGMTAEHNRPAK